MPFDVLSIARHCSTVGQLISRLHLSQEQIDDIEKSTRGQADNPKWHLSRKGRLTVSNFYRIHTRMETLKSNPGTDLSKLVKSILNPDDISNLPAIQHGKKMEPQAVSFLVQLLKRSHTSVKFVSRSFSGWCCNLQLSRCDACGGEMPDKKTGGL